VDSAIPCPELDQLVVAEFAGPHPAGLSGTHIHMLDPVSKDKTVWSINYQDVIAIGKLFTAGLLFVERVISLAGPQVKRPRLLRTRLGAAIDDLVCDELKAGENRIVSGSLLCGHEAHGKLAYLGRYHLQLSVLQERREKELLPWLRPGKERFSILNIFASCMAPDKRFSFSTTTNGEQRAMVPMGSYEDVMPLDMLPTQLLRALIVHDTDTAQALGCLELDEEDLALCTYVCPGKYDYGLLLRECLNLIEKEG
jgi:Na+-transporting NADH:ubiquinone oxidoreductase subunit A